MTSDNPFRIVHLSDLHLTKNDRDARSEPRLFGKLKGMNDAFRHIMASDSVRSADLLLVSGDVTDRGDLEAWQLFWNAVSAANMRDKILVVPGNHDMCCLSFRLLRVKNYRQEDLEKARKGLRLGNQAVEFPWVWTQHDKPRVAVFGLNSNNLGNLSGASNALGEIGFHQLLALASKLHVYRDVPVKIVLLHHSPNIPGKETAKKRNQAQYSEFQRLASEMPDWQRRALRLLCVAHRVRLVLHGHLHESEDRYVNGIHVIGVPASTEPFPRQGQKTVYRFCTYTVSGASNRVKCNLASIPVQA